MRDKCKCGEDGGYNCICWQDAAIEKRVRAEQDELVLLRETVKTLQDHIAKRANGTDPYTQILLKRNNTLAEALRSAEGLLFDLWSDIEAAGKDCPKLYNADFIHGVRNKAISALAENK